jgi:hypothetical protein
MRPALCILAAVCLLTARTAAQENTWSAAGSKVLALESVWNMAEEKADVRALDLIFDDSMIYIDEDGSLLSKAQFLAHVKAAGPQLQSLITKTIAVRVFGEAAMVVGSYEARGAERGKAYLHQGRFMDTWVLKEGAWVCVVAQSTPIPR